MQSNFMFILESQTTNYGWKKYELKYSVLLVNQVISLIKIAAMLFQKLRFVAFLLV